MVGTTLSRYRILEQIGAGGMGVVYRAQDERLQRDVAVKVIAHGLLADDAVRRRFRKEALALSQLNHPNIAVIHDFDSHEGVDFLVMEYIAGETLEQRLKAGPIPESEVLALGLQMADAVAAAHAQGVAHRDLKPANICLTPEGRVKVLDLGLARVLEPAVRPGISVTMTEGASVGGTLAYMAPEVMGGSVADERADVYSLGAVLYEMATGHRPFPEQGALELMYAVLNRIPDAPRRLDPRLSPAFERVILRALEREPARRYPSGRELRDELRAIATGGEAGAGGGSGPATAARIESIAVLPLENLSGDPAQEFFADGMTEALIADLAKLGALRVISRTSIMRFKGVRKPLPEIARELRVDAVVEGSVLRAGDRVRITAQLVDARSDTHLWAESYERAMSDILSLQSEVARAIAAEVRIKLSQPAQALLARQRRVDPAAYDAYFKGRYCWNRRGEADMRRAIDYFQAAIAKDPDYAMAYVGLADTYNLQGFYTMRAPADALPQAQAMARRALELDPTLGEAHNSLAYAILYYDWDWAAADREFQRAIDAAPNSALTHQWYVNLLVAQGRFEEALIEGSKARALDPLSVVTSSLLAWVLIFMGEYQRAIAEMRTPLEMDPNWVIGSLWSAWPLQKLGRHDEAIAGLEKGMASSGGITYARCYYAHGLATAGRHDEARGQLDTLLEQSSTRYVSPALLAMIAIALGEHDRAFEWLDRALVDRSHWMVFLDVDPRFDLLRADPRFEAVRKGVGLTGGAPRAGRGRSRVP